MDRKVSLGVSIDRLQVLGRYSMSSWFSTSKGACNVTIIRVMAEEECHFVVDEDGFLKADNIDMDLKFEDIGFLGKILQGTVNSVGGFIFHSIKSMILQEVQGDLIGELNRNARSVPQQFPNSINPIDMAIASARNLIRERGMDPFPLPDYKVESWSTFELANGVLYGLSTIYRTLEEIGPNLTRIKKNSIAEINHRLRFCKNPPTLHTTIHA